MCTSSESLNRSIIIKSISPSLGYHRSHFRNVWWHRWRCPREWKIANANTHTRVKSRKSPKQCQHLFQIKYSIVYRYRVSSIGRLHESSGCLLFPPSLFGESFTVHSFHPFGCWLDFLSHNQYYYHCGLLLWDGWCRLLNASIMTNKLIVSHSLVIWIANRTEPFHL